MTRFLSSPLRALGRIFSFQGGAALANNVDTVSPIQPVLDVSGLAEYGSGLGPFRGYFICEYIPDHSGGASTDAMEVDPYEILAGLVPTVPKRMEVDIWAIGTGSRMNNNDIPDFTAASVAIHYAIGGYHGMNAGSMFQLIANLDAGILVGDPVGGWDATLVDSTGGLTPTYPNMPFLVAPTGQVCFLSTSSGAIALAALDIQAIFWAGPTGTRPPGLQ